MHAELFSDAARGPQERLKWHEALSRSVFDSSPVLQVGVCLSNPKCLHLFEGIGTSGGTLQFLKSAPAEPSGCVQFTGLSCSLGPTRHFPPPSHA